MCDVECVISVVGGAAGGEGEGAAGCNDKNKNPTIECGEKLKENAFQTVKKIEEMQNPKNTIKRKGIRKGKTRNSKKSPKSKNASKVKIDPKKP